MGVRPLGDERLPDRYPADQPALFASLNGELRSFKTPRIFIVGIFFERPLIADRPPAIIVSGFLTAIDSVPFHFGQPETDVLRLFDDPYMAGIGHFAEGRQADEKQILAVAERKADRSARFTRSVNMDFPLRSVAIFAVTMEHYLCH